jgi:RNA polymerase primary sigma factor
MASDETTTNGSGNDDAPLIDLNEATIKKLVAKGKRKGYLTYDELNAALPQDELSSEQIEDVMSAISEMGVNIVESDEDASEEDGEDGDGPEEIAAADDDGEDQQLVHVKKKK